LKINLGIEKILEKKKKTKNTRISRMHPTRRQADMFRFGKRDRGTGAAWALGARRKLVSVLAAGARRASGAARDPAAGWR